MSVYLGCSHNDIPIEQLFKAIWLLQQFEECDDEVNSLRQKLSDMFAGITEKKGEKKYGRITYRSDGLCSMSGLYTRIILEPWTNVTTTKAAPVLLSNVKDMYQIWYYQMAVLLGRSIKTPTDDKSMDLNSVIEAYDTIKSMSEEERANINANMIDTKNMYRYDTFENKVYDNVIQIRDNINSLLNIHIDGDNDTFSTFIDVSSNYSKRIVNKLILLNEDEVKYLFDCLTLAQKSVQERGSYTSHYAWTGHRTYDTVTQRYLDTTVPARDEFHKMLMKMLADEDRAIVVPNLITIEDMRGYRYTRCKDKDIVDRAYKTLLGYKKVFDSITDPFHIKCLKKIGVVR